MLIKLTPYDKLKVSFATSFKHEPVWKSVYKIAYINKLN